VKDNGSHSFTVHALHRGPFSIWVSWAKIPKLEESPAQKQEMSDGVVTRDEDLAAASRYVGCMDGRGNPIGLFATSVVPSYAVNESAVADGSDLRCYTTEFRDVDIKWQLEVQAGTFGRASIAACTASGTTGPRTAPRAIATPAGLLPDLTNCPWIG
jgi:hypothetical protein